MEEPAPSQAAPFDRLPAWVWASVILLAILAWLFRPVLAGDGSIVHSDSIPVSYSLQVLLAEALDQWSLPLWTNQLYGGHPILAEGVGGFLHPLNIVLFGLFDSLRAHDYFHLICSWVVGIGMFALCRSMGVSGIGSIFAALALAFSQSWLGLTGNATKAGALTWAPLAIFAMERWWDRADLRGALALATTMTLSVLAGYPQAVHALVIYMGICTLVRCLDPTAWRSTDLMLRRAGTGVLAGALTLGLCAAQLLPTLELVGQSIRATGVETIGELDVTTYYRGFFFSAGPRQAAVVSGIGSLLVSLLAFAGLLARPGLRVAGHVLAALFLFQLAIRDQGLLYGPLHHVLPGLDSFRTTHLYFTVSLIGLALLAGRGVDAVSNGGSSRDRRILVLLGTGWLLLFAGAWWLHNDVTPLGGFVFAAVGLAGALASGCTSRRRLAGIWILLVIVTEILVLRGPLMGFVDSQLLRTPPATAAFLRDRHGEELDFKVANVPHVFNYLGFSRASNPRLEISLSRYLAGLEAATNVLWDIPSMHANLALSLARRLQVDDLFIDEVHGRSARPPGERFIDVAGVRYLMVHKKHRDGDDPQVYAEDFREVFYDEASRYFVLENPNALPAVQFHRRVLRVDDAAAAVDQLERSAPFRLLLESTEPVNDGGERAVGDADIRILERSAEHWVIDVETDEPGYLFVADAIFPGWSALVNDRPAALHPAHVLGKAVPIPAGRHQVVLEYRSRPFRIGLAVSLASSALVIALWIWSRRRSV